MTRTVWLASYPKSGNTWFRMLVANLSSTDEAADINELPEHGGIASARWPFDYLTLIDSGLLTHDEADRLRPLVYEELVRGIADDDCEDTSEQPLPVRFVKCHDAYTYTADGAAVLGGPSGADAAILIVRDPRDVAPSLANHNRSSIDEAIARLSDPAAAYCGSRNHQAPQLRQHLLGWSAYQESWLAQIDLPVHLVRYEDMVANTEDTFGRALAFAGRAATSGQIARAVRFASFDELRRQEAEKGFREAPPTLGTGFFRRGITGAWRDELTAAQVDRIEEAHAPMMRRLGYRLSFEMKEGEAA
jgi:hypothetical protein